MSDWDDKTPPSGWIFDKRAVFNDIRRLEGGMNTTCDKLDEMRNEMHVELTGIKVEIAQLKVKASIWGALAGIVASMLAMLMRLK